MATKYFASKNVKIFPCTYRGTYGTSGSDTATFDPEARISSEYNLIHNNGIDGLKDSYIIDYADSIDKLYCVVGGYYFELTGMMDLISTTNGTWGLYIKTRTVSLRAANTDDAARSTKILASWTGADSIDTEEGIFTGICLANAEVAGYTYCLILGTGKKSNFVFDGKAKLPNISAGDLIDKNSIVIGTDNQATAENNLATGKNTKATANQAATFGESTIADKENLTVVGKYNTTEDGDLFVVGNGSSTVNSNVLQVNEEKVVLNKTLTTLGIANIAIDESVNLSAADKVTEVNGSLKVDQKTDLVGSFSVNTDKFKVNAETGEITITGPMNQSKGQVSFNGNIKANNGLDITKDFTVSDGKHFNLDSSGNISTDGNLTADGAVTLGANTGSVILSKSGSVTQIKGDTQIDADATIAGNFAVATDKLKVDSATGQVTIANNTDINGGLDITGNNLTVGGKHFIVTSKDGTISSSGNATIASAGKVTLSATDKATIINGSAEVKQNLTLDADLTVTNGTVTLPGGLDQTLLGNATLKAVLLDTLYPIGSVYISAYASIDTTSTVAEDKVCPIHNTLGGTWERITDRFLYAVSNTVNSNYYGTQKLTEDNKYYSVSGVGGTTDAVLLKHSHTVTWNNTGAHNHTVSSADLKGKLYTHALSDNEHVWNAEGVFAGSGQVSEWSDTQPLSVDKNNSRHWPSIINFSSTHTHTISGGGHVHDITLSSTGDATSLKDKNMPPYMLVYMWKRTK